ncbi:eRF1 methyltransferase catalytic subunit mtq2 [Echinococcus granulosus]|uniref:Methyltransferase HEMK2 n=1 Tax=Echinococcus granulosus TaxID=6210 RepID=A0A068WW94_ECHGR|nr:eRF1 methyltransferase catalytic subunit mtq2 [Echinococcus granulosus]CDS22748.1 hemK methyltransferase family [Echinococcus granulosus]
MLPLDRAFPTPDTDVLRHPCFAEVYPPSEDSFLFLDALEADKDFIKRRLRPVLSIEVGSGSGIISTFLSSIVDCPCSFICIDISNQACVATKQVFRGSTSCYPLDAICCDLLSSIRTSSQGFADIVLFNPPYVPTEGDELLGSKSTISAAWAGGFRGRQVTERFIQQVTPILARSGVLYILLLLQNEPELVSKLICDASNGRLSRSVCILQRRCWNEQLFVYRYYDPLFYLDSDE